MQSGLSYTASASMERQGLVHGNSVAAGEVRVKVGVEYSATLVLASHATTF